MKKEIFERLPSSVQADVQEFVAENNAEFGHEDIGFADWLEAASAQEVVDAYLSWNGILGWSERLVNVVRIAFEDVESIDG